MASVPLGSCHPQALTFNKSEISPIYVVLPQVQVGLHIGDVLKWGYPQFYSRIFHYKHTILRYPHWRKPPILQTVVISIRKPILKNHEGIYLWFGAPKWIRAPNINGETYMKCWEAGHAEKHTICWKACFVVTLSCLFFWWKWWNLNAEKQVMLRSTKSAEKHVLLWNVYFDGKIK